MQGTLPCHGPAVGQARTSDADSCVDGAAMHGRKIKLWVSASKAATALRDLSKMDTHMMRGPLLHWLNGSHGVSKGEPAIDQGLKVMTREWVSPKLKSSQLPA
jgi:hypothetical protein